MDDAAPPVPEAPADAGTDAVATPLTRSARRGHRSGRSTGSAAASEPSQPLLFVSLVGLALALVLATRTDIALLAAGVASLGLIIALGWPALLQSRSALAVGVPVALFALASTGVVLAATEAPVLRNVPVVLAGALVLAFVLQLFRRDGRPGLTGELSVGAFALGLCVLGLGYLALLQRPLGPELACVALAATAAGGGVELGLSMPTVRHWMLPVSMLLGGLGGLVAASFFDAPGPAPAFLVGVIVSGVALSVRRALACLPDVLSWRGQVTSAAASTLASGMTAYVLSLTPFVSR